MPSNLLLFIIQDAKYSLIKNKTTQKYISTLKTEPPLIQFDDDRKEKSPASQLKFIRNIIVHETPYVSPENHKINYISDDGLISMKNMWLRGFSELFTTKQTQFKAEEIAKILRESLDPSTNLSCKNDVNMALSLFALLFQQKNKTRLFHLKMQ